MNVKNKKRLPYGTSNFESLITEDYYYVDKTGFIEMLEQEPNKNLFFTRPRKFGKSLFLSMLSHYYDINGADKFETLFGNLYIGKHPTPKRNSYLVLNLDFSGLDTASEELFVKSFAAKIESSVRTLMILHENIIPNAREIRKILTSPKPEYGVQALNFVFDAANDTGRKVYVIIDEYDHFANDIIAAGTQGSDEIYQRMVSANGIVRDFYETLKAGTKTVVDRIILTGITPIMLDDMTSGFNITNNISLDLRYNEILGFTQEEVNRLMEETGVDKSLVSVDMEYFYNGYRFHPQGRFKVYNSSIVLYFFSQITRFGMSENIIDDNLKTDYGRLQRLIRQEENRQQLMEIAKNNGINGWVIDKFSIKQLNDSKCFTSLLFYMGLLTIDTSIPGLFRLKIPNYSIRTIYWEYIEELTRERNKEVSIDLNRLSDSMYQLGYQNNHRPFINYVSQNIVSRLSDRDLRQFDEKYLKIILLNTLIYGRYYIPLSETEVSRGYTDIYLRRTPLHPDLPCEWVFEIKYIKKSDGNNPAVLQEKRNAAREQLNKYRASHLFAGRTDVRYLAVIFTGKNQVETEEISSLNNS
jgi:hypothetical protein